MIRINRQAWCTTVKCSCGFRQSANTDAQADVIARNHTCEPPRTSSPNANRTSARD